MPTETHVHSSVDLDLFREKVAAARRQTGRLQRELADALNIDSQVLSRKLHGYGHTFPTHVEVKQIIKTLTEWDALTTRAQAIELLSLMGLKAESFSEQEWNSAPLNRLESAPSTNPENAIPSSPVRYARFIIPVPPTSLIGREHHVQILLDRLRQSSVRFLTLLGAGGVGKTRLALEVARAAQHDFADGVFFVSLETILDASLVPSTIAQALHLLEPLMGGDIGKGLSSHEDLLKHYLQDKKILLVLDNVEQIPGISPFISDLLSTAEALKVMVTSRAVLHLYGEYEFDVPPLEVSSEPVILSEAKDRDLPDERSFTFRINHPELSSASDIGYASTYPAIQLFVERAQAVNPAFQITNSNAAIIAQICARLDGLPLAIELAAARTKVLSLSMILQRLADRTEGKARGLTFLRSTAHNVLSRHQTLYNTLDWSYELLDPQQQRLFRRLGVFLGGWTLGAALAICITEDQAEQPQGGRRQAPLLHPSPLSPLQDDMLEQMEFLMDQSLVRRRISLEEQPVEENTEPRFHFLETIREYALAQLEAGGEHEDMQRRHAAYYLALAERVEPDLYGREQSLAVSTLAREQDNLRAAILWAIEHNEADIAQRMCGALSLFWEARTQFQEAHRWIDAALTMSQETAATIRAKLLMAASRLELWEVACERSRELAQEALTLYEAVGDIAGKTQAMFQIGDTWHMQGEYTPATSHLEESLPLLREQKNWRLYGFALSRLGAMAILQGNFVQAWTYLSEAVTLQHEYSEPGLLNVTLVYLGVLAFVQGNPTQSTAYLREGLLLAQRIGNRYMLATDLIAFGCVLGTMRGPSFGARICSAAESLFESLNTALPAAYQPLYSAYLSNFQSQVDEATWQTWWAEGKAASQEEITTLTLTASQEVTIRTGTN